MAYSRSRKPTQPTKFQLFTPIERADRLSLSQRLSEGSHWNNNFGIMLGCSVLIAGLGLIQNSVAVIIGARLVAPLMTPLIGMGLALVQGNIRLLSHATKSMSLGTVVCLVLGMLLEWLTPGQELTLEIASRSSPNLLDLAIAFLSGFAAGYAIARPKLSGALPGVAISVALVPPLAASGIAFGAFDWKVAVGAFLLFLTNLVAIVLGSALVFRLHGIRIPATQQQTSRRTRRILIAFGFSLILLLAPLAYRLIEQVRHGQAKPEVFTLSEEMWYRLHDRLAKEPGVDFLTAGRASSNRPEDVTLVITADRPVDPRLLNELDQIINHGMGYELKVKINVLQQATILEYPGAPVPSVPINE